MSPFSGWIQTTFGGNTLWDGFVHPGSALAFRVGKGEGKTEDMLGRETYPESSLHPTLLGYGPLRACCKRTHTQYPLLSGYDKTGSPGFYFRLSRAKAGKSLLRSLRNGKLQVDTSDRNKMGPRPSRKPGLETCTVQNLGDRSTPRLVWRAPV